MVMNLSIIIPAYNASATIARTLNSILSLSMPQNEYEIIVVDDCSTDNTLHICNEYMYKHSNIRVLHQLKNHRQGAARNRGVKEAQGKYVMYVDADDLVENGVAVAIKQAEILNVDVLFCNYKWMYSDTEVELRSLPLENECITSGRDFAEYYYDMIVNTCPINYIWNRKYLLNGGIWFVEDRQMEDFDYIEQNVYNADRVGYSTEVVYKVLTYSNKQSTTHTFNYKTAADWVHVSYRRLLFCDTIREHSPLFCAKIESQCKAFVSSSFSFRRVSRFSPFAFRKFLVRVGKNEIEYLYDYERWAAFTRTCLKYPNVIIILLCLIYPVASLGRMVVQLLRKTKV